MSEETEEDDDAEDEEEEAVVLERLERVARGAGTLGVGAPLQDTAPWKQRQHLTQKRAVDTSSIAFSQHPHFSTVLLSRITSPESLFSSAESESLVSSHSLTGSAARPRFFPFVTTCFSSVLMLVFVVLVTVAFFFAFARVDPLSAFAFCFASFASCFFFCSSSVSCNLRRISSFVRRTPEGIFIRLLLTRFGRASTRLTYEGRVRPCASNSSRESEEAEAEDEADEAEAEEEDEEAAALNPNLA